MMAAKKIPVPATKPSSSKPFGSDAPSTPWPTQPSSSSKPSSGPAPSILQWFSNQVEQSSAIWNQTYPERWVIKNGKTVSYRGPGHVDENNVLQDEYAYEPETEARAYYGRLDPAKRNLLMNDLVRGGFLDKNSLGDYSAEMNALMQAFDFANVTFSTLGKAVNDRIVNMPVGRASSGATRVYRTTSTEDLTKLAKRVAQDTLGRELTDSEAAGFANAYQQQEIQFQKSYYGGGTVMEAPSPEVAAQTFAQQTAPTEAAGYKYLGYINKLFNAVGVQ
jgi:hypothetical protein